MQVTIQWPHSRKRLPCGEVEKARKAIRTFFLLRSLSLCLQGEHEAALPLSNPDSFVQVINIVICQCS